ncbi:MAG TPA: cysteine-rich CWC family protein [Burkholderiales bacterium]|nr:cysteine-rich CWC family protein [Burkholderiales bacterium]
MIQKAPGSSPRPTEAPQTSRCARCGDAFECGARAGRENCWCGEFPALASPIPGSGCYCPRCLGESIETARGPRTERLGP